MNILKETTEIEETLPISFLTDMVSKGWEEVGYLKDTIATIKESFKDTTKVEAIMQDLMDAYLVFIGQVELYLDTEESISPDLAEVNSEKAAESTTGAKPDEVLADQTQLDTVELQVKPIIDSSDEIKEIEDLDPEETITPIQPEPVLDKESITDFFVDFDEPDLTEPRVTDADLYGEENSETEYNKLRSQLA